MWAMLGGDDLDLLQNWMEKGPEIGYGNQHLTVRSIKMYMDGALGSSGAWLLEEYTDRPGHFGHSTTPIDSLTSVSERALQHGFQVCSHAIGDRAIREVLDRYQQVFEIYPEQSKDARFRIEHAQHINAQDLSRFADLGVIASMQAIHLSSDRPWAIDRLGQHRIEEGAYIWQKLLQSGAIIVNGSDVPVEPIDPLASFYASITRKTLLGTPEGGFEPDQRMTREQALRSYTLDAAFGAFEEDIKGSIEVGKLADFTVFSQDIMEIPEQEILETEVVYTIVGGKVYGGF
jgi:predicted amidohydrolase YtcJ